MLPGLLLVACVEYALLHTLLVVASIIYDAVVLNVKLLLHSGKFFETIQETQVLGYRFHFARVSVLALEW